MGTRIMCIAIGYICGLLQTGYFYGKLHKIDIREHGSGNAGTTNTLRTLGWKAGAITFFGDFLKAVIAILIVRFIFGGQNPEGVKVFEMYAGMGAILGHNFPFYLKFKGGKGIASMAGVIVGIYPILTPVVFILFVGSVALTRYVSLGSILVVIGFFAQLVLFAEQDWIYVGNDYKVELYLLGAALMLLAIYKHRENIKRLLNGTENKFGMSKK